jgi:glucose dehydrogenase
MFISRARSSPRSASATLLPLLLGLAVSPAPAQDAEWRYWGGDPGSTRYSPLDQIDAGNFEELTVAWIWRGDNFGPTVDYALRAVPIYVDGILYAHTGSRRTVVAIDPATGDTLWSYREPDTPR